MSRRIEIWRIILWSGLTNLLLLSVFLGAQRLDLGRLYAVYRDVPMDGELWLPARVDLGIMMPTFATASETKTKGITTPKSDFSTSALAIVKSDAGISQPDESEALIAETGTASTADLALAAGASVEDSENLSEKPILRKNPQSGKLEIGNFKSLSVVGSTEDCLDFGHSLLSDAGSTNDRLDVMTAADEITIARICAANGSIIISCRGGQIAVSPRKPRPDDRCAGKG